MKKEKYCKLLYAMGALLFIGFCMQLGADFVTYDEVANSAPFSVFVLERAIEFLVPGLIFIIAGKMAKKGSEKQMKFPSRLKKE